MGMKLKPDWYCGLCGRKNTVRERETWCPACHPLVIAEIIQRCNLPCGHSSPCPLAVVPAKNKRWKKLQRAMLVVDYGDVPDAI